MQELNQFPLIAEQPVAWGDMDAFGHVNNVIYYRYAESARISYLEKIGIFDLGIITVISQNSCRYLSPVVYPDHLKIGVRVEEIRHSAFRMSYSLYSEQQKKIVAQGESILVCLDAKNQAKTSIPEQLKQDIIEFEKTVGHELL